MHTTFITLRLEKYHKRLPSLSMIEIQLRAPLKPLVTIVSRCSMGFRGGSPMMPRYETLSENKKLYIN